MCYCVLQSYRGSLLIPHHCAASTWIMRYWVIIHEFNTCSYIHVLMNLLPYILYHICIYIYIYVCHYTSTNICIKTIYIYIYTYFCACIYIYIYSFYTYFCACIVPCSHTPLSINSKWHFIYFRFSFWWPVRMWKITSRSSQIWTSWGL